MWLSLDRQQQRRAGAVADGTEAAHARGRMPRDWYDAQCLLPEAVDAAKARGDAERLEAVMMGGNLTPG
jgi:hypothetical protein